MSTNDFGKVFIAEECQRVAVSDFIREYKLSLKKTLLESALEVEGVDIELATTKTGFGGVRFWFKCPSCGVRVGVLYKHPIHQAVGCRNCLGLDYRKRRYKGMIESGFT